MEWLRSFKVADIVHGVDSGVGSSGSGRLYWSPEKNPESPVKFSLDSHGVVLNLPAAQPGSSI